jgi:hypothetical protein
MNDKPRGRKTPHVFHPALLLSTGFLRTWDAAEDLLQPFQEPLVAHATAGGFVPATTRAVLTMSPLHHLLRPHSRN